ncbi:MAG: 16S rRNA (guanine(966)-N(2))-methyltransferase RsmD [Acidobacteria bacterium]|nr:16S rRNA (guanine(966)-N(2))-methyltransferase RsmD [Acidobacteriota bacterium]
MRIISGTHKGRVLASPTWDGLRPTSDRLRETLFNVLAARVDGAAVLDVCAGTGAIALEALSRGAATVTCLESDARAVRLIAANAAHCGLENRCIIIRGSAPEAVTHARVGGPFDLVILDPPYAAPWLDEAVAAAGRLVTGDGLVVLEHSSKRAAPAAAGLQLERTRRAGDSALSTYRPVRGTDGKGPEEP